MVSIFGLKRNFLGFVNFISVFNFRGLFCKVFRRFCQILIKGIEKLAFLIIKVKKLYLYIIWKNLFLKCLKCKIFLSTF